MRTNYYYRKPISFILVLALLIMTLVGSLAGTTIPVYAADTDDLSEPLARSYIESLMGAGVTLGAITQIQGKEGQFITFSEINDGIEPNKQVPFDEGLILSTGKASMSIAGNGYDSTPIRGYPSRPGGTDYASAGDSDLLELAKKFSSSIVGTTDAAILEFEVIPKGKKVVFEYFFTSTEYDQPAQFNDIFALYVNGENMAILEGGGDVTIQNTVARSGSDMDPNGNSDTYTTNNGNGEVLDHNFLGYTKKMTVVAEVTPNVVNTIRLAIADTNDGVYDSAVFIKAGSISTDDDEYAIFYETNGGSGSAPHAQTVSSGGIVTLETPGGGMTAPAGAKSNPDGWILTNDAGNYIGTYAFGANSPVITENIYAYANWIYDKTLPTGSTTFSGISGISGAAGPYSLVTSSSVTAAVDPDTGEVSGFNDGDTITIKCDDGSGNPIYQTFEVTISGAPTINHTVTVTTGTGMEASDNMPQSVTSGGAIDTITISAIPGYLLPHVASVSGIDGTGISYNLSGDRKFATIKGTPNQDVTVMIPDAILGYIVSYNLSSDSGVGSGTTPTSIEVGVGESFTVAEVAGITPPPGKSFKEWNTASDGSGTSYAPGQTVTIGNTSIALHPIWTQDFTVEYDNNGGEGTISSNTVVSGGAVTMPAITMTPPTGAETTPNGWIVVEKDTGTYIDTISAGAVIPVTKNLIAYANWMYMANIPNTSSPTYSALVPSGSAYNLVDKTPTGTISVDPNTGEVSLPSGLIDGDTFTIETTVGGKPHYKTYVVTLYDPSITVTVTYLANGGGGIAPLETTIPSGSAAMLTSPGGLTEPTSSAVHGGWVVVSSASGIVKGVFATGENVVADEDLLAYANWTYAITLPAGTDTFDAVTSGGSGPYNLVGDLPHGVHIDPSTGEVSGLTTGDTITVESKDGTGNTIYNTYTFTIPTAKTITVSAINAIVSGTNPQTKNTGTSITAITITANSGNILPPRESVTGISHGLNYTLSEDRKTATITGILNFNADIHVSAVTGFGVTYSLTSSTGTGSGTIPTSADRYVGEVFDLAQNTGILPPAGKTLKEWNTQANGGGTTYALGQTYTMGDTPLTLYAVWQEGFTLTYKANGGNGTAPVSQSVVAATSVNLNTPGGLFLSGATLEGWIVTDTGNSYVGTFRATESILLNQNLNAYANWTYTKSVTTANPTFSASVPGSVGGYSFLWTPPSGVSLNAVTGEITVPATVGTVGTFTVVTVVAGEKVYKTYNVTVTSSVSGGGSGGSSTPSKPAGPTGVIVIVDGKKELIGNRTESTSNGETKADVAVNPEEFYKKLDEAKNGSEVIVPVPNAETVVATLNAQMVKDMEKKNVTLEVAADGIRYQIPAEEIKAALLPGTLGKNVPLSDIEVKVTIATPSKADAARVVAAANGQGYEVTFPPVEFRITASNGGKSTEIKNFESFVSRIIALPEGVDGSKYTTAITPNQDGSMRHVPTEIFKETDGRWYAKINSLTNSIYTLIYNQATFQDARGKWYEKIVEEATSRTIIMGRPSGKFEGEAQITRAEFATIIVRILGLEPVAVKQFKDLPANYWGAGYIGTAYSYGIIKGKTETRFDPEAPITRQEAMAMLTRAASLTPHDPKSMSEAAAAAEFTDFTTISPWAKSAAIFNIANNFIVGSNGKIRPQDTISRAESATVAVRLMRYAFLFDVRNGGQAQVGLKLE